ncbi:MAG: glycosyl hydrolase, partial [bacterium]|nr:glycosyl hydrolase [bacterium]
IVYRFGLLAVLTSLFGASGARAQVRPPLTADHLAGLEWRALGPAGVGGRVTDIEALPHRPATIYLGSASGGVFKSVNHGTTWRAVFDGAENLSVGDIAVSASDPNVVWVGTGEPNNRNSSPHGRGVYKSADAGETWRRMGLEETRHIGRVLIHPSDPNIVFVAAVGHLFGPNPERGVYRTEDGGKSWERVMFIDDDTGIIDMAMDPVHPTTLYAAAYQRRRRAFGFVGGGPG